MHLQTTPKIEVLSPRPPHDPCKSPRTRVITGRTNREWTREYKTILAARVGVRSVPRSPSVLRVQHCPGMREEFEASGSRRLMEHTQRLEAAARAQHAADAHAHAKPFPQSPRGPFSVTAPSKRTDALLRARAVLLPHMEAVQLSLRQAALRLPLTARVEEDDRPVSQSRPWTGRSRTTRTQHSRRSRRSSAQPGEVTVMQLDSAFRRAGATLEPDALAELFAYVQRRPTDDVVAVERVLQLLSSWTAMARSQEEQVAALVATSFWRVPQLHADCPPASSRDATSPRSPRVVQQRKPAVPGLTLRVLTADGAHSGPAEAALPCALSQRDHQQLRTERATRIWAMPDGSARSPRGGGQRSPRAALPAARPPVERSLAQDDKARAAAQMRAHAQRRVAAEQRLARAMEAEAGAQRMAEAARLARLGARISAREAAAVYQRELQCNVMREPSLLAGRQGASPAELLQAAKGAALPYPV